MHGWTWARGVDTLAEVIVVMVLVVGMIGLAASCNGGGGPEPLPAIEVDTLGDTLTTVPGR